MTEQQKQDEENNPTNGFVVKAYNGRYLSRSLQWVRHKDDKLVGVGQKMPGNRRAFVHPVSAICAGGFWDNRVLEITPACYDPKLEFTAITGQPMSYEEFLDKMASPAP